jgi:uncharacterized protein YrrD
MTSQGTDVGRLLRGKELMSIPVVTLGGDDVAEVRDVVYEPNAGQLVGFTLNKRGWLAGRHRSDLAVSAVAALGRDAIMIRDVDVLATSEESDPASMPTATDRNVLGSIVLTEDGTRLGAVEDVVISTGTSPRVEGYVLAADRENRPHEGQEVFIPLPEQIAVSGDALVVPTSVAGFIRDDLAGFGAAISEFRAAHAPTAPARPSKRSRQASERTRSKAELYREATRRGIPGRSSMSKAELERALEKSR